MSYAQNSVLPPLTLRVDEMCRWLRRGLSLSDSIVMGSYAEVATLDTSDARVRLAAWEVAKRTGLSLSAVKRSLSKLFKLELLVRRQDAKAAGVVAWTQVSREACELLGAPGGAALSGLPDELKIALVGESVAVCDQVGQAWKACASLPESTQRDWRGAAYRLDQVRRLLAVREQVALEKALEAQHAREEALVEEGEGIVRISCPDGAQVVVDARQLDRHAPCPADVGFGRDVLHELAVRHPELVTPSSVPKLLAEILYSRSVGFLSGREYVPALRILTSCLGGEKKPWGRPKGMWSQWYDAANHACRLSTGGSISVH